MAGPWQARVGRNGVGRAREGSGRTPAGIFPLGTGFGVGTRDPGSRRGWFTADARDWWASDVLSPSTYNRHVRCRRSACPFRIRHAEQLVAYPRAYPHTGGATAGCVSLPSSRVVWMLRRMKPGAVVSIGVGSAAYAPLHACLTW